MLLTDAPRRIWPAFRCSHSRTYSHNYIRLLLKFASVICRFTPEQLSFEFCFGGLLFYPRAAAAMCFLAGPKHRSRLMFYKFRNNPNPFLILTLGLSTTLRQRFGPKYYTKAMFRRLVLVKLHGCSSIGKTWRVLDPSFCLKSVHIVPGFREL